jgi:hypothetical protein
MTRRSAKPSAAPRPRLDLPVEIVDDILQIIRSKFYQGADPKNWFQDLSILKRMVVLWPATWLTKKGVTLPGSRYKEILITVLLDIAANTKTEVKYMPRYLAHCVQKYFAHHGDEIYDEAKALRKISENVLLGLTANRAVASAEADARQFTDALSQAAQILSSAKRKKKLQPKPAAQLSLL